MGQVIAFPRNTSVDAQLMLRLLALTGSGQRESEAYRCLEAEMRRRKAIDAAERQARATRRRR